MASVGNKRVWLEGWETGKYIVLAPTQFNTLRLIIEHMNAIMEAIVVEFVDANGK
jgi:hypothetical protein